MMTSTLGSTQVDIAVARLDAWFDTILGPDGYGGPVAHWWQQSFVYTGVGRDWRYEGIIAGYLNLWERTGSRHWLGKARCAANHLVAGQLANGNYAASAFEINPATAGTPHEAACDVGLLLLALALRKDDQPDWERYAACAERNIRAFLIEQLWDDEVKSFRDQPAVPSLVPNKAATICDALFLMAELTGDSEWVDRYALTTLDRIISHQVAGNNRLDGAIAQNSFGATIIEKYFPIYIARCIPALLKGYDWTGDDRYAESALAAMRWIVSCVGDDGSLPTAIYADGSENPFLRWIAPLGDVLRAGADIARLGYHSNLEAVYARLLAGQDETGGIRTADGFAAQASGRLASRPDVRDLLHVAGWVDKAFRYFSTRSVAVRTDQVSGTIDAECSFYGRSLTLTETPTMLVVADRRRVHYRWHKGEPWAAVATPNFWLR